MAFEPTRSSAQQLEFAYERVVATVRRTPTRKGELPAPRPQPAEPHCSPGEKVSS
jgi:hypothetical protein